MSRSISNRREFLRSTGVLAAAGAVVPYWLTGENARADETTSPNDRPNVALIGCGSQGTHDAQLAAKLGQIVALCDVDRRQAEKAEELGVKADIYQDYRRLLDRKDIELVIHATPDHWHTAINIAACKAGKDVYAEKPLTLTIDEGKTPVQGRRANRPDRSGRHDAAQRTSVPKSRLAGAQRPHRQAQAGVDFNPALFEQGRAVRHAARAARTQLGHVPRPVAAARLLPSAHARQFSPLAGICRRTSGRLGQPPR